jgi:hypothetical protein
MRLATDLKRAWHNLREDVEHWWTLMCLNRRIRFLLVAKHDTANQITEAQNSLAAINAELRNKKLQLSIHILRRPQ